MKVLVEGTKRVKIVDFKDDNKFITCTFEYLNDQFDKNEDLMPLATTAVRRLDKLNTINIDNQSNLETHLLPGLARLYAATPFLVIPAPCLVGL